MCRDPTYRAGGQTRHSERGVGQQPASHPSVRRRRVSARNGRLRHHNRGRQAGSTPPTCPGCSTSTARSSPRQVAELHRFKDGYADRSLIAARGQAVVEPLPRVSLCRRQGTTVRVTRPPASPAGWRADVRLTFVNSRPGPSPPPREGRASAGRSTPRGRHARPVPRPAREPRTRRPGRRGVPTFAGAATATPPARARQMAPVVRSCLRLNRDRNAGGRDRHRVDVCLPLPRQRVAQRPPLRLQRRERALDGILRAGADPTPASQRPPATCIKTEPERREEQDACQRVGARVQERHRQEDGGAARRRRGAGPRHAAVLLATRGVHPVPADIRAAIAPPLGDARARSADLPSRPGYGSANGEDRTSTDRNRIVPRALSRY